MRCLIDGRGGKGFSVKYFVQSESLLLPLWAALFAVTACGDSPSAVARFELRIENIATPIDGVSGEFVPSFSPGWVLASPGDSLYEVGQVAPRALESTAEDGDPTLFANVGGVSIPESFGTNYEVALIEPGESMTTTFEAMDGDTLSYVAMFGVSNDAFVGLNMPLFVDGEPVTGELAERAALYDAGTEVNEPFGAGMHQPGRGTGGPDEEGTVQHFESDAAGNTAPPIAQMLRITLRVLPAS